MFTRSWRAFSGTLVVCGVLVAAALPAAAADADRTVTMTAAAANDFPSGKFMIHALKAAGGSVYCVEFQSLAQWKPEGSAVAGTCEKDDPLVAWTYDPTTKQIRRASNPKLCMMAVQDVMVVRCDYQNSPLLNKKPAILKRLKPWHLRWYLDSAGHRLYNTDTDKNVSFYLCDYPKDQSANLHVAPEDGYPSDYYGSVHTWEIVPIRG